jgi:hypothetical protein
MKKTNIREPPSSKDPSWKKNYVLKTRIKTSDWSQLQDYPILVCLVFQACMSGVYYTQCPEGDLRQVKLVGNLAGCGSSPGVRWLQGQSQVVGRVDVAVGMTSLPNPIHKRFIETSFWTQPASYQKLRWLTPNSSRYLGKLEQKYHKQLIFHCILRKHTAALCLPWYQILWRWCSHRLCHWSESGVHLSCDPLSQMISLQAKMSSQSEWIDPVWTKHTQFPICCGSHISPFVHKNNCLHADKPSYYVCLRWKQHWP